MDIGAVRHEMDPNDASQVGLLFLKIAQVDVEMDEVEKRIEQFRHRHLEVVQKVIKTNNDLSRKSVGVAIFDVTNESAEILFECRRLIREKSYLLNEINTILDKYRPPQPSWNLQMIDEMKQLKADANDCVMLGTQKSVTVKKERKPTVKKPTASKENKAPNSQPKSNRELNDMWNTVSKLF